MSYSSMRFVVKLHTDCNPCLTTVWGLLTSYTQATIHVVLRYEVCWQVTHRLQSISYSGMRFVDITRRLHHVLLRYEVCWQTHRLQSMSYSHRYEVCWHADYNPCYTLTRYRLQSMSYSGMRFVDKLHTDYNPCLTPVWGLLTSYTRITIHVLLRYEVCWQVTHRLQSMSYSGMRFVDKLHADYNPCLTPVWGLLTRLHTDYNPCLTPVWGLLTSYTQTTIHVLLRYEVYWQDTRRLQSMSYSGMRFVDKLHADYNPSYSGMRFVDKLHADYNPCLTPMRFVDKLHADYNPCLTPVWGLLTSYTTDYNPCLTPVWGLLTGYTQTTIHVLLQYEVCCQVTHRLQSMSYYGMRLAWQVTRRLQSMSYSGMRFVDKLHTDYNPCLTLVWGLLTSYTQITIHVLLWYEVCWQVTRRLQSMSYSGMRFVDKLYTDYNPCLTPVWGLFTSYTQTTIHVLLWYEVCWQITRRLQTPVQLHMSYSGMRFVDKLHADYNPCLTPVWGLLTSYTQTTIHVLLRYEVCWQVTRRLQSMSYSGMRFVDKTQADYNPCLTLVWGLLTGYTQTTIHILLRYEVYWQDTRRLQSMSYSGMRFVDKLHADYNPSYSGMRFVDKLHLEYNPCLTLVWGLLTSYMQTTIHVLLWYEVCWQVTRRLQSMSYSGKRFVDKSTQTRIQSMSYSGMRFVDKLQTDYNPCLTPVWGLLTGYTQTTIHVLLQYEVCWQVTHRLQSMSYYGMRLADKLHAGYNPCRTPVWGLLTSYTQITIHILLWYEVCWQVTHRLQSMSYSGMRFVDKLHTDYNPCWYEVCWQDTHRLQSMSYSGMRFVDKLHTDYNPCLTPVWSSLKSYTQTTIHVLLRYEVCWQVTRRLRSMSYSGMRFVDKLHADYNPCLTPVWGL